MSHDSAHNHADDAPAVVLEHPLVCRTPGVLVTKQDDLLRLVDHLRSAKSFAYDSEFIGELTYVPKLCLIQVATTQQIALIDPLAELDLKPFWELLCDPSVEKIVHAGQQDLEPVFRHVGRAPANVLDTQIAAGFVGLAYPVALSRLVGELVGVKLGKGLTFTHWDQRPLSAVQLRYAADDVRYLPAARQRLREMLESLGHAAWASEESATLCDESLHRFDPESDYLRIRGAASLPAHGLAVLRELSIWRDTLAREHNVPPRTFLRDEILLDLARTPVKTFEKLSRVRGLPRPVESAYGPQIVEATLRALAMDLAQMPVARQNEQSPTERFRCDAVWAVVQTLCISQSLDPALVASRHEVADLCRILFNGDDPASSRLLRGWRRAAIGQKLLDLVAGQSTLTVQWSKGSLRIHP